jgi:predicted O-methyltransferase YrrM
MSKKEVGVLKEIVKAIPGPCPTIIQIGAERGVSTMAILETRPDAFIFSIDIGERSEEIANVNSNEEGLDSSRVVRGLGRSQAIGSHWPREWAADLIYIDGDHRYEGVYRDIEVWSPHVKWGRTLLLHDYIHPRDRGPHIQGRVWEAVEDARENALSAFSETLQEDRLIGFQLTNFSLLGQLSCQMTAYSPFELDDYAKMLEGRDSIIVPEVDND